MVIVVMVIVLLVELVDCGGGEVVVLIMRMDYVDTGCDIGIIGNGDSAGGICSGSNGSGDSISSYGRVRTYT